MVFLPLQSTNVATARLFPYLGPEGQTNAVATAPFSFTDYRIIPTTSRAAAEGGRRPGLPFLGLSNKPCAEFNDHKEPTGELLKLFINFFQFGGRTPIFLLDKL